MEEKKLEIHKLFVEFPNFFLSLPVLSLCLVVKQAVPRYISSFFHGQENTIKKEEIYNRGTLLMTRHLPGTVIGQLIPLFLVSVGQSCLGVIACLGEEVSNRRIFPFLCLAVTKLLLDTRSGGYGHLGPSFAQLVPFPWLRD